eukprot:gene22939-biopygen8812
MRCCSSFGVEWVGECPETFVGKLDYSQRPSVSFARPERACGGSDRGAKAGILRPRPSLESWTHLRSHPPPPRARAARRVGAEAQRETRICSPEKGEKRQQTWTGRGPDAGRTVEFEETDADRTRVWPFLPGLVVLAGLVRLLGLPGPLGLLGLSALSAQPGRQGEPPPPP